MVIGLWRWRTSDFEDEACTKLLDQRWQSEPFQPHLQGVVMWSEPSHVGAVQSKKVTKIILPDGREGFRAEELVRVS